MELDSATGLGLGPESVLVLVTEQEPATVSDLASVKVLELAMARLSNHPQIGRHHDSNFRQYPGEHDQRYRCYKVKGE